MVTLKSESALIPQKSCFEKLISGESKSFQKAKVRISATNKILVKSLKYLKIHWPHYFQDQRLNEKSIAKNKIFF